jgi:acetyl-CoA carboxylase biotin carboxyl carrier protein
MSLTAKDVAEIMRLLEESSFDALELESGDLKLSLRRGSGGAVGAEAPSTASRSPSPKGGGSKARSNGGSSPSGGSPAEGREGGSQAPTAPADPNAADIPSPLLGVFYRAPKPGEAPFVEVGSVVEEDTVIAIIEVMKLMNSVRAGVKGEVVEILAENGALVEYDQPLMRVRKS